MLIRISERISDISLVTVEFSVEWMAIKIIEETLEVLSYWEITKQSKKVDWHEFLKNSSVPNPGKKPRSILPRPIKSASKFIRYNCQMICSWMRRPKTILKISKRPYFLTWSASQIRRFSKILLISERSLIKW